MNNIKKISKVSNNKKLNKSKIIMNNIETNNETNNKKEITKLIKIKKTNKSKKIISNILINNKNNKNENEKKISKEKKSKKINKVKKTLNKKNKKISNNINNEMSNKIENNIKSENKIIKDANKKFLTYFKSNIKNNLSLNNYKKEINEYQNSFDSILEFSKNVSTIKKKSINCIIYHAENSDGIMSAYIALQYLKEQGQKDITIIPAKPSSGFGQVNKRLFKYNNNMKDKNILILDLQYNQANLEHIKSLAKNVYIIDDHEIAKKNNKNKNKIEHFIGDNSHACIAYTWKFFNPKKEIPLYVQIIDNDDRKLQLPFLSQFRKISSFYNYRIFHSPYLTIQFDKIEDFDYLDNVTKNEFNLLINMIGHYYEELANNIKDQVARNARKETFQGHPVYVLNYNDPVLSRMVGRQMLTNAQKRGEHIDFAVLWGYEYTNRFYRVQLVEFHGGKPKYNLPQIAKTLGDIGRTGKGGGGASYVGNFYWPHSKDKDIWDLFSKNYLKNKMN